MRNGIIFIWSEKEHLGRLLKIMEEKGFFYIENMTIALLDHSKTELFNSPTTTNAIEIEEQKVSKSTKQKNMDSPLLSETTSTTDSVKNNKNVQEEEANQEYFLQNLDKVKHAEANHIFYQGESSYFAKSKKVLMMFRRNETKENNLELRHQRTCDALFDLVNPNDPRGKLYIFINEVLDSDIKTKEYVYRMIETLLPKALYDPESKSLKMMELYNGLMLKDQEKDGLVFVRQTSSLENIDYSDI